MFRHSDAYHLNAVGTFVHDVEYQAVELNVFTLRGYGAGGEEYIAGYGLIVVAFGQVEMELFVDGGDFASAREIVNIGSDLSHCEALSVVFILDIAENLFHEVFERDKSGRAAKFVNDHGQRALLLQ